jgi:pilus assembly protein Flp/PilA
VPTSAFANWLRRFSADETGATSIEYAIVACGIAVAIVGAVTLLSGSVLSDYQAISDGFK